MNIKIEGWKVTLHNENGDRLELKGEFEADFFKEYNNKQLIIADSHKFEANDNFSGLCRHCKKGKLFHD